MRPPHDPRGRLARAAPNLLCFASSMAIMVLELVAGRLVARNVGSSQYTWTAIIGVILAGMSFGNWYGGRLADRHPPARLLWQLLFSSSALVVLTLPLNSAISSLKRALIPVVIAHPAGSTWLWGLCVLALMTVVFLLPATALGLISPVVARMAIDANLSTGRAIGNVYSWGAVGAIAGVFLTGFVLVSYLPVVHIILLVAGALAVLGAMVALGARLEHKGDPAEAR